MDPPQTPLRPAAAVTGTPASLQAASTAETSSVELGRTTTAGRCGTAPSVAQPMAIGHQSRPGLGPGVVVEQDFGTGAHQEVEELGRDLDDTRAEAIGDAGSFGVDRSDRGRLGSCEIEPRREQFLLACLGEAGHLLPRLRPRPNPCRGR